MTVELPREPVRVSPLAVLLPPLAALMMCCTLSALAGYLFVTQPSELQRADQLFADGHYRAAFDAYSALAWQREQPGADVLLRLGIVYTLRGEFSPAERVLWLAVSEAPPPAVDELATLYLGHVLASRGQSDTAREVWQRPGTCATPPEQCPYAGPLRVVQAEWALQQQHSAEAEQGYRDALGLSLPADWHALARYRLALLQAASDPAAALAVIEAPPPPDIAPAEPLLRPLLPPDTTRASTRLVAILRSNPIDRPQLLGQMYLELGLYQLATEQFDSIAAQQPHAPAAAVHKAYARWLMGEDQASIREMEQLAARYPQSPTMQTMLAFTYIAQATPDTTLPITSTLRKLPIDRAETHLARAMWNIVQSEYIIASEDYRRALALAPPEERGAYALLIARFHLNTAYEICTEGLDAAHIAARELPDDPEAWAVLAGSLYQCHAFNEAADAARHALDHAARADAAFYLGAALAHLGEWEDARAMLTRAADLAPASIWRRRAELLLAEIDWPS